MVRLNVLFVGLVVVLSAVPSWGLMVGGSDLPAGADAEGYLGAGSGGVSALPEVMPSDGGTALVIPIGPTPTPPPDNQTPIPPTPPPPAPVPEPGTVMLLGLGVLGIAAARRRRRA